MNFPAPPAGAVFAPAYPAQVYARIVTYGVIYAYPQETDDTTQPFFRQNSSQSWVTSLSRKPRRSSLLRLAQPLIGVARLPFVR